MAASKFFEFLPDGTTFRSSLAAGLKMIYAPLCGTDGQSLKSSITPLLSGDIKIHKGKYLTKPASREDLREPARNFFVQVEGHGIVAAADPADAQVSVEIGQLWHQMARTFPDVGVELRALTFIPVTGEQLELTKYTIHNISGKPITVVPTTFVPIFARALANKHDHEHVTALLNRVEQAIQGVVVEPTMLFNEEGHRPARSVYYVFGADGSGLSPAGSFPTMDEFLGDGGDRLRPLALVDQKKPRLLSDAERQGMEAAGALQFAPVTIAAGASQDFIVAAGVADDRASGIKEFSRFATSETFAKALDANKAFWSAKTSSIVFTDGDKDFSAWMRWVTLQPILRRIFGCSFLPDHDYGKGGKGWRDIWQDLLSLILIEPAEVRQNLLNNFGGVRIDGTNATIIGQKPGEFIADRNAITRVWMDHGVWPFTTTLLYIDQTGDVNFLFEKAPYFTDPQASRTFSRNVTWTPEQGNQLKDKKGKVYSGTVLEHILVQNLVQFFNVGDHNITRLESADWNDGLDMAFKHGESVAFMSFYAGNFLQLADLLEKLASQHGCRTIEIARELVGLLDTLSTAVDYDNIADKKQRLFEEYFKSVQPELSGDVLKVPTLDVVRDLRKKGQWIIDRIRAQEKVSVEEDGEKYSWFNGYYDNDGERVEGKKDERVRMTLTGQVFPVMHGVATPEDIHSIVKSVRRFLKDETLGGFRLNTDFGVRHYLSMGRAFGFAFGTKENGAVFSHMAVMYGYALYKQGFAREGHEVLRSLYTMAVNGERAKIYPGIPEYFDSLGRGMYHFLTGSASWYVLTLLTMAYGVRGELGDLVLSPKLVKEDFGSGEAIVTCQFAGKTLTVTYVNPARLDFGRYRIAKVVLNGRDVAGERRGEAEVKLARTLIADNGDRVEIKVVLSE